LSIKFFYLFLYYNVNFHKKLKEVMEATEKYRKEEEDRMYDMFD